jgi:TonB family protein
MRPGLVTIALVSAFGCAAAVPDHNVTLPERRLESDTVDIRGIWRDKGLDASGAAARGLDPATVQLPRKIRDRRPSYPPAAMSAHITGTVTLDCIIEINGEPQDCQVISGPALLRTAATDAVAGWRWDPLRVAGIQRRAAAHLTVNFNLGP